MMKSILKVFFLLATVIAALVGIAYYEEKTSPRYVDIYSDDDQF
ncbi:MAG: hypothetical protein PHG02_06230 [Oscillospiraceae bacterium]|nr:hypothetical protein [Oscillospiraceae bacterium]